MKPDYAPLLVEIAGRYQLAPIDVVHAIHEAAPGSVSRRAVGYWMAGGGRAGIRRCAPEWVSLLLFGLQLQGKLSQEEHASYRQLLHEIADGFKLGPGEQMTCSPLALRMISLALARDDMNRLRQHPTGSLLPFDAAAAACDRPGF